MIELLQNTTWAIYPKFADKVFRFVESSILHGYQSVFVPPRFQTKNGIFNADKDGKLMALSMASGSVSSNGVQKTIEVIPLKGVMSKDGNFCALGTSDKRVVKDENGVIQYETEEYYENEPVLDQDNNPVFIDDVQQFISVQKFRDVPKKIGEREYWESKFGVPIWNASENTLEQLKDVVLYIKTLGFDNIDAFNKLSDFIKQNNQ